MPDISTVGVSMSSGHDSCPPVVAIIGSATMSVNSHAVVCVGDQFDTHGCPAHSPHNGIVTTGSSVMSIDGKAVAIVGSQIGSGGCPSSHVVATGDGLVSIDM
jgi:uncharacterized Zn-binding protein involved in type VI secretion